MCNLNVSFMGLALSAMLFGCNGGEPRFTVEQLDGGWFSGCDEPAADFVISDGGYLGEFKWDDSFRVSIDGDRLTFSHGFGEGHYTNTSGVPLTVKIIEATRDKLVLETLDEAPQQSIYYSCDSEHAG